MKRLLRVFFLLIFFAACTGDKVPEGVIAKDEMIKLLTDIHMVDGYIIAAQQDTGKRLTAGLHESVFRKHKTDSAQFKRSVEYYVRNPEEFTAMYKQVDANLDTIQNVLLREQAKRK